MSFQELVGTAAALGCKGVEVRNDLSGELFDGLAPEDAKAIALEHGVQIEAVAEVPAFNDGSSRALDQLQELSEIASRCDASGVSLIPWLADDANAFDSSLMSCEVVQEQLSQTLVDFSPILAQHQLKAFIEPLGFKRASIRFKSDVVAVIKAQQLESQFKLVHDTFHHHLAQEPDLYPEYTGIVHVSGVSPVSPAPEELNDSHRGLVNSDDTLGNLEQLTKLMSSGYQGPVSIEAFAPAVHNLQDPKKDILACLNHIGPSTQVFAA